MWGFWNLWNKQTKLKYSNPATASAKMAVSVTYIGATWCKTCKTIKPQIEATCKKFKIPLEVKDYDEDCTEEDKTEIKKVPTIRIRKADTIVATYDINQVESTELWLRANVSLEKEDNF